MHWGASGIYKTPTYWEHVDRIIHMADELGLYMALLPSWGRLLKTVLSQKIIFLNTAASWQTVIRIIPI